MTLASLLMHGLALDSSAGSSAGLFGGVVGLAIAVLMIASEWVIFSKAGKPGWAAIIPIYSLIVYLQVVGRPIWWIILFLIPLVNIVIGLIVINDLSKAFGHKFGFTLGLIFLSIIFYPILAFGGSKYVGPLGVAQPQYANVA
ncbi:MAG: DUF5684 domain-containing protein [Ktedonobacterales bacterium]|jgi:hypothetical protein